MSTSVPFVHNRYQERGGEDSVFEAESALLEARGHRVERLLFDNRDLSGAASPAGSLRLAVETIWSGTARRRLAALAEQFQPDVVHFHNTLPKVSPAAYGAAKDAGAAVVQTLHNFRMGCPSGLMYRQGSPCDDCLGQTVPWQGVLHGCYRGSRAQTGVVASMLVVHRLRGTYRRDVDLYLAPSEFLRKKVIKSGLEADRVVLKPNFLAPDPGAKSGSDDYVLFVGRLTETKGIKSLLKAYGLRKAGLPPLRIAGEGDLANLVQAAAASDERISFRGALSRDQVLSEMSGAMALVFPSIWYENFPMAIVEALACGLPVVASRLGALPELVADGHNGALFKAGDATDLGDTLAGLAANPGELRAMGLAARFSYLASYSGDIAYDRLVGAYEHALGKVKEPVLQKKV